MCHLPPEGPLLRRPAAVHASGAIRGRGVERSYSQIPGEAPGQWHLSEADLSAIDQQSVAQVDEALRQVLASPIPDLSEIDLDLFVQMKGIPA